MTPPTPLQAYRRALDELGFVPDHAQAQAVDALQACHDALHRRGRQPVQGVYLWGPVGRGKTWLMDSFYQSLDVPKRRQHFHHFVRWVHRRCFQLSGTPDPLRVLARELRAEARVLCFDELFISDIGDAMILGRLLQAMLAEGVVLVATSNQPPQALYADGFNRERLLPAIQALEEHMQVVRVEGAQDHRLHPGARQPRYWVTEPGSPVALDAVFERLAAGAPASTEPVELGHRPLPVVKRAEGIIWCRYADLCERPLAAFDFIVLCDRFPLILLGDVPELSACPREARIARGTEDGVNRVAAGDRELQALSRTDDGVRRFIALVDECYDRRVPLYVEAAVPLTTLYTQGALTFPFRRTLSRLQEMQLQRFGRP
ncbi:cell division protein ZapE [Pseudomonas sp. RIT-PI-AD]|uniref:cell division protein ZapE n=1 Tax=Pseudomonas sp. RIT-PI-AD TaxID=3035294 RepID=UPI0021D8BB85|nr:cell division protein ZapE [Pseudomonas sp. RIT-PI-AD]